MEKVLFEGLGTAVVVFFLGVIFNKSIRTISQKQKGKGNVQVGGDYTIGKPRDDG